MKQAAQKAGRVRQGLRVAPGTLTASELGEGSQVLEGCWDANVPDGDAGDRDRNTLRTSPGPLAPS